MRLNCGASALGNNAPLTTRHYCRMRSMTIDETAKEKIDNIISAQFQDKHLVLDSIIWDLDHGQHVVCVTIGDKTEYMYLESSPEDFLESHDHSRDIRQALLDRFDPPSYVV